jgi:SAM-dependent MidA family methyltransferase
VQAIRKHKFVHILDDPGSADLSAYVDFSAIKHSAEEVSGLQRYYDLLLLAGMLVLFMVRRALSY